MKIEFCVQVCLGAASDPANGPKFIGLSVSVTETTVIFHIVNH